MPTEIPALGLAWRRVFCDVDMQLMLVASHDPGGPSRRLRNHAFHWTGCSVVSTAKAPHPPSQSNCAPSYTQ